MKSSAILAAVVCFLGSTMATMTPPKEMQANVAPSDVGSKPSPGMQPTKKECCGCTRVTTSRVFPTCGCGLGGWGLGRWGLGGWGLGGCGCGGFPGWF